MKLQALACAVAILGGSLFFSNTINNAFAESAISTNVLAPTRDQSRATKQVATLVDRRHYLNMPLDESTSRRVLEMYFDNLDPDHIWFLQSDINEFRAKYATTLGKKLKTGDLAPATEIYQRFRKRLNNYLEYSKQQLDKPQNLYRNDSIDTDREKAPFFATEAEQKAHWQKMLVSQLINLTISKEEEQGKQKAIKDNPSLVDGQDLTAPQDLTPVVTLQKRLNRQIEQQKRVTNDVVIGTMLNSLLNTYDPHSSFFTPREAMEFKRQTTLALEGIGVSIRSDRGNEDYATVEAISNGGPASKSGQVRVGDRIIGVGQDGQPIQDVVGWPISEVVGVIRGKKGTKVNLHLQAKGSSQIRQIVLTRDVIQQEDARVRSRVLEVQRPDGLHRIGIINVPSFYFNWDARSRGEDYRSVSEDTAKALVDLQAQQVEGIVFDLRNNPGGNLDEVVKMLGQLVKSGPLVQTREANGSVEMYTDPDGGKQLYGGPLATIIDLGSASASEIFSAAIQDYQRGIVIGSTTLGKGTAQGQLPRLDYPESILTLTERKFYRITGGSTQNKGVIPDVPLVNVYSDDMGERKLKNALKWDTIQTAPYQREGVVTPFIPALDALSDQRVNVNPQFAYLKEIKRINDKFKNEKQLSLNIDVRKKQMLEQEASYLSAENTRRQQTGSVPYANWESYQASVDARAEARAKMQAAQRPPLPEEEAYVVESANILLDMITLKKEHPALTATDPALAVPASASAAVASAAAK